MYHYSYKEGKEIKIMKLRWFPFLVLNDVPRVPFSYDQGMGEPALHSPSRSTLMKDTRIFQGLSGLWDWDLNLNPQIFSIKKMPGTGRYC